MNLSDSPIVKLLIELNKFGTSSADLDQLFAVIFRLLAAVPNFRVQKRGAILLFGSKGRLIVVSHSDMPTLTWKNSDDILHIYRGVTYIGEWRHLLSSPPVGCDEDRFMVLPLCDEQVALGSMVLFIDPSWHPGLDELGFADDLAKILSSVVSRCRTSETLHLREKQLEDARTSAIHRLGTASEFRDNETAMHIMRMSHYARTIAKAMDLPTASQEILLLTAPMHDVGKIGISDTILLKPCRLSADEFEAMKRHAEIGARMLEGEDELFVVAREIAQSHHENWDGTGYPHGLSGESIPLFARICAVADVFDALTSWRPYKHPWTVNEAAAWIRRHSGVKFDPRVVAAFEDALTPILRIRELYRDDIIDPRQILDLPEPDISENAFVVWDDSLSTGIDTIDVHHLYLIDLINNLHEVVTKKAGIRNVAGVLQSLESYAKIHFRAEEKMMQHYGYSLVGNHQNSHRSFEEKLCEFSRSLQCHPLTVQYEILDFLQHWLINHIRCEDSCLRYLTANEDANAGTV